MTKLCPQCQQPLNQVERWGVQLDVCQSCQGVWLEAGELEQIVGFVRASQATATPQGVVPNGVRLSHAHDDNHEHDHDHEYDERQVEYDQSGKPRRKRRFEIGDIFDIFG